MNITDSPTDEQLIHAISSLAHLARTQGLDSPLVKRILLPSLLSDALDMVRRGESPDTIRAGFPNIRARHRISERHAHLILKGILLLQAGQDSASIRDQLRPVRALSTSEASAWCKERGFATDERGLPIPIRSVKTFEFSIPSDCGKRVAMVREHTARFPCNKCLIWLHDWSVWPSGQWLPLFMRLRESYGITDSLYDAPAHLIDSPEADDAVSIILYSVLMLWDVYVMVDRTHCLFYSHDEHGTITA